MRIGMFTAGYQRYPLEKAFSDAKKFGYDFIELWGGRPWTYAPDILSHEAETIRALSEKYGMPIEGYTPEHNAYPFNYMAGGYAQRKASVEYLKSALIAGKAIGARFTLVSTGHAGYGLTRREIEKRLYEALSALTELAEEIGHKILLETLTPYETNVCTTVADLKEVLDKIDSPVLSGMCDLAVPFSVREPVMNYFELLGSRIEHLHIIDNDGVSDGHLVPGEGVMPLKEILQEIKDFGYDGTATVELVTAYIHEPSVYAKRAVDNLRAMIG